MEISSSRHRTMEMKFVAPAGDEKAYKFVLVCTESQRQRYSYAWKQR